MSANDRILLIFSDTTIVHLLERSILGAADYRVSVARSSAEAEEMVEVLHPDLAILGDRLDDGHYLELAARLAEIQPTLPILLFTSAPQEFPLDGEVLRLGVVDWLKPPLRPEQVVEAVERGLARRRQWQDRLKLEARRHTGSLEQRVSELETLAEVGRSVTAQLDLDRVLAAVVEAAVELTGAEEGSLLLLDEHSGELYMRAARNFQDEFVRTFRLPAEDTLAGEVISSGKPFFLDEPKDPQKIKTSYLVYSLIYVPLKMYGRTIGVLGVDNRQTGKSFEPHHVTLLSAMADYAAVAIENAQLYSATELERDKLETVLTQIRDGVIVCDPQGSLILVNHMVREAFGLEQDQELAGKPIEEVFRHEEMVKAVKGELTDPNRIEIEVGEGGVFSLQVVNVPQFGTVATLHDITYLKELDRMKSEFVNTVSHDLRSPLTAILGYVELIERVGETNENQREYIRRIRTSVRSITDLVTDLLDLGRIEVGVDADNQMVSFSEIVDQAVDALQHRVSEKKQSLKLDFTGELPQVVGNPVQLRRMLDNLLANAVKYTPENGQIRLFTMQQDGQFILQVIDTGRGIPTTEQARVFDKFFRASNVDKEVQGSGLGLAIVKSIVEKHGGRIWVDSVLGEGSTFTVVLPVAGAEQGEG